MRFSGNLLFILVLAFTPCAAFCGEAAPLRIEIEKSPKPKEPVRNLEYFTVRLKITNTSGYLIRGLMGYRCYPGPNTISGFGTLLTDNVFVEEKECPPPVLGNGDTLKPGQSLTETATVSVSETYHGRGAVLALENMDAVTFRLHRMYFGNMALPECGKQTKDWQLQRCGSFKNEVWSNPIRVRIRADQCSAEQDCAYADCEKLRHLEPFEAEITHKDTHPVCENHICKCSEPVL